MQSFQKLVYPSLSLRPRSNTSSMSVSLVSLLSLSSSSSSSTASSFTCLLCLNRHRNQPKKFTSSVLGWRRLCTSPSPLSMLIITLSEMQSHMILIHQSNFWNGYHSITVPLVSFSSTVASESRAKRHSLDQSAVLHCKLQLCIWHLLGVYQLYRAHLPLDLIDTLIENLYK